MESGKKKIKDKGKDKYSRKWKVESGKKKIKGKGKRLKGRCQMSGKKYSWQLAVSSLQEER